MTDRQRIGEDRRMMQGGVTFETLRTRCCIAGGGPAGMMLGFLLARAGVDVIVLEKHGDFLRDFRGDTIHPSTLQVMHELGLLGEFLERPHQEVREIAAQIGDTMLKVADFSHLPTRCKFIAFMPQWDFLDFLAAKGRRHPSFALMMQTEARELLAEGERVVGLKASSPSGAFEIRADLVVAADGRHSILRRQAGLELIDIGAPIDVLWMRLPRRAGEPPRTLGRIDQGHVLVLLDRGDYWQCAFVIPKGRFAEIQGRGIDAFRAELVRLAPYLGDGVSELRDWNDVKLLTVAVDRLRHWHRPGLLCIGDAAHAMSPIGGVGINLAVQDAVATANILMPSLRDRRLTQAQLQAVQRRRELPTRLTQRLQVAIQDRVISRVLAGSGRTQPPLPVRLLDRYPLLRRLPARIIGVGFRPEHVRTPAASF